MITEHVYVVNAGYLPIDYLADRYLANVIGGNDTFKALAHKLFFPEAGTPLPDAPRTGIGPLAQYRLMEANPASSGQALRVQPSLLGYRTGHRDAETAFFGVDAVANATRELKIRNGRVFADKRASVRQGVWDTGVEKVPGLRVNPKSRSNAVEILPSADAQDIDMHVITSPAALDDVDLSPAAAHLAQAELENGYALTLPETTPQGVAMSGWWRVRLDTGETLGMTADGYGAELVEYPVDMIGIGMGLIDAVKGLRECEEQPTMDTRLCCLMQAHLNTTTGNAIGSVGGAVADSSTSSAETKVQRPRHCAGNPGAATRRSSSTFKSVHHQGYRHDARRPIQPIPICLPNANKSEATVPAARTISRLPFSPLHPCDIRYNRRAISEPSR